MKNTKTKTTKGWVIRNLKTGRYVAGKGRYENTTKLENAALYPNRNVARSDRYVGIETVLQVEKNGKEMRVIGGNGPNCKY